MYIKQKGGSRQQMCYVVSQKYKIKVLSGFREGNDHRREVTEGVSTELGLEIELNKHL